MLFITINASKVKRIVATLCVMLAVVILFTALVFITASRASTPTPQQLGFTAVTYEPPYVSVVSFSDEVSIETTGNERAVVPAYATLDKLIIGVSVTPPLDSAFITSRFGFRDHPINGVYSFHSGLDLAAQQGTEIHAVLDGTVSTAGWISGYGNCVILDHEEGLQTLYAHCSKLAVEVGDEVAEGGVIAYVGSTGNSTGPHLHIEFRLDGRSFDPSDIIAEVYE